MNQHIEQLEKKALFSVNILEGFPGFYEVEVISSNPIIVEIDQANEIIEMSVDGQNYVLGGASFAVFTLSEMADNFQLVSNGVGHTGATVHALGGNDQVYMTGVGSMWLGEGDDYGKLSGIFRGEWYG